MEQNGTLRINPGPLRIAPGSDAYRKMWTSGPALKRPEILAVATQQSRVRGNVQRVAVHRPECPSLPADGILTGNSSVQRVVRMSYEEAWALIGEKEAEGFAVRVGCGRCRSAWLG